MLAETEAASLKFRGTGATAAGAMEYVNRTTLNQILANTNQADIAAFRNANYVNLNYSVDELNKINDQRGLPVLKLYDEGYIDVFGTFQTFIPDGKAVIVGKRDGGMPMGNFMLTPSLHRQKAGVPAGGFFSLITVNGPAERIRRGFGYVARRIGKPEGFRDDRLLRRSDAVLSAINHRYQRLLIRRKKMAEKDEAAKLAAEEAKKAKVEADANAKPKKVRVICEGTLGTQLLKKGAVTKDEEYVALLETERGRNAR